MQQDEPAELLALFGAYGERAQAAR